MESYITDHLKLPSYLSFIALPAVLDPCQEEVFRRFIPLLGDPANRTRGPPVPARRPGSAKLALYSTVKVRQQATAPP